MEIRNRNIETEIDLDIKEQELRADQIRKKKEDLLMECKRVWREHKKEILNMPENAHLRGHVRFQDRAQHYEGTN